MLSEKFSYARQQNVTNTQLFRIRAQKLPLRDGLLKLRALSYKTCQPQNRRVFKTFGSRSMKPTARFRRQKSLHKAFRRVLSDKKRNRPKRCPEAVGLVRNAWHAFGRGDFAPHTLSNPPNLTRCSGGHCAQVCDLRAEYLTSTHVSTKRTISATNGSFCSIDAQVAVTNLNKRVLNLSTGHHEG